MTENQTRIVVVDEHAAFRQPLAFMLEREDDFVVIAEAGSVAEARAVCAQSRDAIDVMIVDLQLPDGAGVDVIRMFHSSGAQGHVLVLTANVDKLDHARAIEAGALSMMSKTAEMADIVAAVRRTHAGEPLQSAREMIDLVQFAGLERARLRAERSLLKRLTPRERQVLEALVQGLDNKAIAERLFISPDTARAHVVRLLAKLQVESRLQAALFAMAHGIGTADTRSRRVGAPTPLPRAGE